MASQLLAASCLIETDGSEMSLEPGDDGNPHGAGRARADVVVAVGGGVVLLVEQVLQVHLEPEMTAQGVVSRRIEPGEAGQRHRVVDSGVHVVLVDHTEPKSQ